MSTSDTFHTGPDGGSRRWNDDRADRDEGHMSFHRGHAHRSGPSWLAQAEGWLDARGKGAWIALMVLGFVFVWPVGLALLAYMIWSKRMFSRNCSSRSHRSSFRSAMKSSGNTAFDSYKTETLRRLEDEQASFEAFLERLREAKDKAEFDQFMSDRARKGRDGDTGADATA